MTEYVCVCVYFYTIILSFLSFLPFCWPLFHHLTQFDCCSCIGQRHRRFGLKEEYADTLVLCRYCRSLFWRTSGHACGQPSSCSPSPGSQAGDPSQQQQSQRSPPIQQQQQAAVLSSLQQQLNHQIQQHVHQPHHHHHAALNNQEPLVNAPPPAATTTTSVPLHIPIPPQAFLKFFSL